MIFRRHLAARPAVARLAALVLLGAPLAAAAQQPAPAQGPVLTLSAAYRAALEQDAQLGAARAAADARRERLPQARSQLLPNVSFSAYRNKHDLESTTPGPGGVPVTNERSYFSSNRALTVRQPLYRPAQVADYRQAEAIVADANATLDREEQNLAVRVSGAYFESLLAQDQLALVAAQRVAYQSQLDSARRRFAAGAGVRTDIDEAQSRVDMAIAQELEARQQVEFTRRSLRLLVNRPFGALAPVDPARLQLDGAAKGTLEDWTAQAESTSPELRALRAQRDAARIEIDKARAGHKPTLDAVAQWSVSQSDNVNSLNSRHDNKYVGLQLNVPIFAGGYVNSLTRQALAELEKSEQTLEATRRELALRVEKEYRGVTEGALRIRALEQAVRSSEVTLVSTRRSFEGGVRTVVDVLNAEQNRAAAVRDLANARYLFLVSQVRLLGLAGKADAGRVAELDAMLKH